MRYYAEWLDGEYVLLDKVIPGYDHFRTMERAIRFHALFGSTIVLSHSQMTDSKCPIPKLFNDPEFRAFLKEKQIQGQEFLTLVAAPVKGVKDLKLAIALQGMNHMTDQKSRNSYETAVVKLGDLIAREGSFDPGKHLRIGTRRKTHVHRLISGSRHPSELTGILHAINYFSNSPLPSTTMPATGGPPNYIKLLESSQNGMDEPYAIRIQEILRKTELLPDDQKSRRSAIRRLLGQGQWQHEVWPESNLSLYLDVVHAWNYETNCNIAPEAGSLYKSSDSLPLGRQGRSVTDTFSWSQSVPIPSHGLSERIRQFLSWNPARTDWKLVTAIARNTQNSAKELQRVLKSGGIEAQTEALKAHAEQIACCLHGIPREFVTEFQWSVAHVAAALSRRVPTEAVVVAKAVTPTVQQVWSSALRMRVVNTIVNAASGRF